MRTANDVQSLGWDDFLSSFDFRQGEHVTLIGTTGSGKTTLANAILPMRKYVVKFGTKRKDSTLQALVKTQGFKIVREWPPPPTENRVILWPRLNKMQDVKRQQVIFGECLEHVYRVGGWTVDVDEIRYITDWLKLSNHVELLLQQGRSMNLTVIGSTQRPRFVPLTFFNQATHIFLFRENDKNNIKRFSEIGSFDAERIESCVSNLRPHETLYLNTRTGKMIKTKVEKGR